MNTSRVTAHPLLNWVLLQGREMLAIKVQRVGERYEVSISSPGLPKRLYASLCQTVPNALQLHAALVAGFRDAGWTSIAYR
jgi:hypothetical protein